MFEIENLHVAIEDKEILKGVDLTVNQGEIHALMGPNGSGKSTLAYVIAGHPRYEVTEGSIRYQGEDILEREPDERARKGLFLAFQYPTVIPGVSMANFLRMAVTNVRNARAEDAAANGGSVAADDPARVPQADAREDGAAEDGRRLRHPLSERGLLRRREEARRDPADGAARADAWRSSTRPTPGSTSTRCASSPRASTRSPVPRWASC